MCSAVETRERTCSPLLLLQSQPGVIAIKRQKGGRANFTWDITSAFLHVIVWWKRLRWTRLKNGFYKWTANGGDPQASCGLLKDTCEKCVAPEGRTLCFAAVLRTEMYLDPKQEASWFLRSPSRHVFFGKSQRCHGTAQSVENHEMSRLSKHVRVKELFVHQAGDSHQHLKRRFELRVETLPTLEKTI